MTMSKHEHTLAVIEKFYDAAMDETLWPTALKNLVDLTGSQAASFWVLDGSQVPRLSTFVYINFDPKFIEEYLEHVTPLDPTVQYLVSHPQQSIVHDGLVITEGEKEKHPYYDWHGRHSETRFRMVGQARVAPAVQAGVALHRTRKVGRYEPRDIERFAVLYRHLEQALTIGFRLGSLGAMQRFSTEWLDRNSAAIVLLNKHMRVVFANRSAQALQSGGDGIRFSADGLTLASKRDNDKLQSLIALALSPLASGGSSAGGTMRALRPSGNRHYGILVTPVSREYSAMAFLKPAVCVVITDPDYRPLLPAKRLQASFGFTEAEAHLAALVAAGSGLREAAEKLNITYGTARTRLAQIFQKTETRRQGELVRLLLTTMAVC
jgi:DNA-binding CsgD family transcriptional regulator